MTIILNFRSVEEVEEAMAITTQVKNDRAKVEHSNFAAC